MSPWYDLAVPLLHLAVLAALGTTASLQDEAVKAGELREWLSYLSSDEMKGRKTGSPEIEKAARWIAEKFRSFGLGPPPGRRDYFQEFEVPTWGGKPLPAKSVLGVLEGSDPVLKREYILLSAHYDHVGMGRPVEGDGIYNGADDNASGVTTLLGIAASLHREKRRPKRSLLFVAWGAEEMGLRGSRHFVGAPLIPLESFACNLNFEMVGHTRGQGKRQVWITGARYSTLEDFLREEGKAAGWKVAPCPYPEMGLFRRSDNYSFARMGENRRERVFYGIPAHTLSTWGREGHYHQPSDEAKYVDYENMRGLVSFLSKAVIKLADRKDRVEWKTGGAWSYRRPPVKK